MLIWAAQWYVRSQGAAYKPPALLEPIRKFHNIALSAVSLIMAIVMIGTLAQEGRFSNFTAMACVNTDNSGWYGVATLVYLASKIWEWADTLFLVFTGKPVIFLHFFHHMTTFTMAATTHNFPVGAFCFINCLVHFVMYLHYSYPVRWARPYITSGQLLQFVIVTSIHAYGYINSPECYDMAPVVWEWFYCEGVVLGYFVLFINFFVQQYMKPPRKKIDGNRKKD
jgi:elongation of very long chain fatty acids protein 6